MRPIPARIKLLSPRRKASVVPRRNYLPLARQDWCSGPDSAISSRSRPDLKRHCAAISCSSSTEASARVRRAGSHAAPAPIVRGLADIHHRASTSVHPAHAADARLWPVGRTHTGLGGMQPLTLIARGLQGAPADRARRRRNTRPTLSRPPVHAVAQCIARSGLGLAVDRLPVRHAGMAHGQLDRYRRRRGFVMHRRDGRQPRPW